jgi:serine phosphatase RsbU (regulator of sigma subunit)
MPLSAITVREVMLSNPVCATPQTPLRTVMQKMNELRIGSTLITDEHHKLLGIFTERDLLRRVVDANPHWRDLPVSEWMTKNPHTISPDMSWQDAFATMSRLNVRHLPVVQDDRVVGLVSTGMLTTQRADFLNRLVEERTRELKTAIDEVMSRDAELRYNLRAAGRMQTRLLLPHSPPDWSELKWGVHYAPLDHLGGDYYDVAQPNPEHLGFLIADASGHSIAAAMVAIMSRSAFADVANTTVSPGAVLAAMNSQLQGLADERFVTASYGVMNRDTRVFTYSNAGHPYPLRYVARTREVQELAAQGFMLGIIPDEQYREKSVQLEPGDRICFYTDGLVEARNEVGEGYGTERLQAVFREYGQQSAEVITEKILQDQRAFRGTAKLSDDVTLVVGELAL